jgi:FkbM family methyltransferase
MSLLSSIQSLFQPIVLFETIEKIPLANVDSLHHCLYSEHKFTPPNKPHVQITCEEQEIIKVCGFNFCTHKNDTCISDSLKENILFEKFLLSLLSHLVPSNKNMLDIGANIGVYSIIFSKLIDNTNKIYAFEPQEKIYNCLVNNIYNNECTNVLPFNLALSNINTTYLMNADYSHKDNFGAFRICSEGTLSINSKIGDELELTNVGFIKIDVEGHELEVLHGLSNTIKRDLPLLSIEIHESSPTSNEAFSLIRNLGYNHVTRITHCDYIFAYKEPTIDIFIKTYYKDFPWLEFCLKSIKKFASGFRDIVIVSDNDGRKIPSSITDILPVKVFYSSLPKPPSEITQPVGYIWQQIIKLQWMDYSDADNVLIMDSDEMFSEPTTPNDFKDLEGKWRWFYRDWKFAGDAICWKQPTTVFLDEAPLYEAMCVHGFIFNRYVTSNLLDYVKRIHGINMLWELFDKKKLTNLSEFNAFGSFIFNHDSIFYSKYINNDTQFMNHRLFVSWSHGGITNEIKAKMEAILNN